MHLSNDEQIVHEQHYNGLKYQNNVSRQHPTNRRQCPVTLKSCVTPQPAQWKKEMADETCKSSCQPVTSIKPCHGLVEFG